MQSIYTESVSANSDENYNTSYATRLDTFDRGSVYPDNSLTSDTGLIPSKADECLFDDVPQPYAPTTYFVSALCGAGKTVGLADYIAEETRTPFAKNFLYVCPTVVLMNEFSALLEERKVPNVMAFNYEVNKEQAVASAVISYCKSQNLHGGGNVILISHATFIAINRFFNRRHWSIFIDEAPQITQFKSENIQYSHVWLKQIIAAKPYNAELIELTIKNKREFAAFMNSKDSGVNAFKDLLKYLHSDNYRVLTKINAYDALQGYDGRSGDGEDHHLPYVAEVKPDVFEGVTVMGADLEKQMICDFLKRAGHNIITNPHIHSRLNYTEHPQEMADRLTMYYLLDEDYSKGKAKKGKTIEDHNLMVAMHTLALDAVGQEPFVYLTNKGDNGPLCEAKNGKALPHKSYGLNEYRDHTRFISIAAFRRDYTDLSLHTALGYGEDSIRYTTQVVDVYQSMMRTNLRVKYSTEKVLVVISDKYVAEQLAKITGCARPSKLGDIQIQVMQKIGKARIHPKLTQTEKNQNANANKLFKKLGLGDLNEEDKCKTAVSIVPHNPIGKDIEGTIQKTNITQPANPIHIGTSSARLPKALRLAEKLAKPDEYLLHLTIHNTVYDKHQEGHRTASFTISELADEMRKLHSRTLHIKEKARLFNPCQFDSFSPYDEFRVVPNFVSAAMVVLDFDTGTMPPECLEDVFWHKAEELNKLCFILCNSFSRSAEQPNRFRMIIPLSKPITNIKTYAKIVDWLHFLLIKYVPDDLEIGLDPQSRNGVQSYYLPCTNQHHRDYAFLRSYGMNKKDFKKYGLNPSGFERTIPLKRIANFKNGTTETPHLNDDRLTALQPEIDALTAMTEGRHKRYFLLTRRLEMAGLAEHETLVILLGIAKGEEKMIRKARENLKTIYHK